MSEEYEPLEYDHHRSWEDETSFNDVLADTLSKAPYLLVSLGIHLLIAVLLAGLAFLRGQETVAPTIEMAAQPPPPEVEEEEEPEEEIIEEIVEEPVLQEADVEETQESLEETGDPDFDSDSPFENESWNNDVGLGGGAGGKYGGRGGQGGKRGTASEKAVAAALKWLHDHQAPEGYWDSDEFMYYDKYPDKPASDGPGSPVNDTGLTGLSLLAFMGHGNTMASGEYKEDVSKGINWLKKNQLDNGLFGDEVGNPTLYNHAIASMAMGEAYYFANRSPLLRRPVKKAIGLIANSRNPYGVWRYGLEPNGDNDTSITGWMVFALKTAHDGKIPVDKQIWDDAENWFASMTDAQNGRTGYAFGDGGGPGSRPSRPRHYLETFPAEESEALTAVALLCRIFMTDTSKVKKWKDHPNYDIMKKQADLLVNKLPIWDEEGGTIDFYYWYYGTFALNQWGGQHWKKWKKAIEETMLKNQRLEDPKDNFYGSWNPYCPWGEDGGRVYTTSIGALILEVYYRYGKVLGAR